ncbi:MAG: alpha/beta fold hydrolase [Solirubrobacteraceae bacterium]
MHPGFNLLIFIAAPAMFSTWTERRDRVSVARDVRSSTGRDVRRSVEDRQPRVGEAILHGHRVSYRTAGEGPVILLIHGITGDSRQWNEITPQLADRYTVLAPDLLGHGQSAKPRGDYSPGAFAVSLRDLLIVLGHRRATVVGHSLGGGIAMQFSYDYPVFCERLVLVNSGGLGPEVHPLLRAATLPGSELVLPLIAHSRLHAVGEAIGQALGRLGLELGHDLAEMIRGYASLSDAEARRAFLHTLRAVIDLAGQRVNATDRLYLAEMMPTLIVWGRRDPLIPVEHAAVAHRGIAGSRLEIFDRAGHFPQLEQPVHFARVLSDFIETTDPAEFEFSDQDLDMLRERMLTHRLTPR